VVAAVDNVQAIHATGLGKDFGSTAALSGVDLAVGGGQVCAVLGPNGAGKTTLIRCALGLESPTRGRVRIFDQRPGTLAARRVTGVVLQEADLPDALTAREHLALQSAAFEAPTPMQQLIEEADIGDFVDQRYRQLSGGQKRRIQFALALVGRPRLLFLDEPTTGLDAGARKAVWANVRELASRGTTVVLTTHYLEEADALADRVVVLGAGRVVADDDAATIRSRVSGALIACCTRLSPAEVATLPAVRSVEPRGRLIELLSNDAARTLAALLARDPAPTDLTVRKPSLEEAFAALTRPHPDQETH
jgi:ABC-2 type transport system ATP-binding protein